MGVGIAGGKGAGELAATGAQGCFVEDVQRCAVFLHQVQRIAAAQGQVAGRVGVGRVGKNVGEVGRQHGQAPGKGGM